MLNPTVDDINRKLKVHGLTINGDPEFRVVFSKEQIEKRKGTRKVMSGPIFLREETGVFEGPKYPWIIEKWILERWAPPAITYHPDIMSSRNGDYVCIYIFQDPNGNYLPPLLKVAEIVVKNVLAPKLDFKSAINRDLDLEDQANKKEFDTILNGLKTKRELTATERESISFSKYVSPITKKK